MLGRRAMMALLLALLAALLQNALPLGSSGDAHARRLPVMGYSNWYGTKWLCLSAHSTWDAVISSAGSLGRPRTVYS